MSATLEEVVAMLDLETPDDVADLLRSHGIRGVPKDCARCPIALFAEMMTGRAVTVGLGTIGYATCLDTLRLPEVVRTFVGDFDNSLSRGLARFADLVAP